MYSSMKEHAGIFRVFVFCMDDESHSRMTELNLDSVVVIKYTGLEAHDRELYNIKSTRSLVEYYFTCTPAICAYIFDCFPEIDLLTYLDADLYFFSSPEIIFEEIGDKSIAIVEHRFSKYGRQFIKLGVFNVAWISFRRDEQGMACLSEYRKDCLDWCYDYLDGDRYADQKYLDKWPLKYSNLKIIQNKGVNLACWNIGNYRIEKRNNVIYAGNDVLIFYHFAGFKQLSPGYYTTSISSYYVRLNKITKMDIYSVYIRKLMANSVSQDITQKTINPKNLQFSFRKSLKSLVRNCRIRIFNDFVRV
jgi:hypothetical protein